MTVKPIIAAIALFNLMFVIVFIWIVEITMQPIPGVYATNGFWIKDTMQLYHLAMYIMVTCVFTTSMLLLTFPYKKRRKK